MVSESSESCRHRIVAAENILTRYHLAKHHEGTDRQFLVGRALPGDEERRRRRAGGQGIGPILVVINIFSLGNNVKVNGRGARRGRRGRRRRGRRRRRLTVAPHPLHRRDYEWRRRVGNDAGRHTTMTPSVRALAHRR